MTGGTYSKTTEILQDKKWIVLKNGDLPVRLYGLSLATVNNEVFAFGNILN